MMKKSLEVDEGTIRLMRALGRMPPKQHKDMKMGKRKPSRAESPRQKRRKSQAKKAG
jgi:hypothetical protein